MGWIAEQSDDQSFVRNHHHNAVGNGFKRNSILCWTPWRRDRRNLSRRNSKGFRSAVFEVTLAHRSFVRSEVRDENGELTRRRAGHVTNSKEIPTSPKLESKTAFTLRKARKDPEIDNSEQWLQRVGHGSLIIVSGRHTMVIHSIRRRISSCWAGGGQVPGQMDKFEQTLSTKHKPRFATLP